MTNPTNVRHVDITTNARNIATGLARGNYEAQFGGIGLRYFVGGDAAPADLDDYWPMLAGGTLRFPVGGGGGVPIWAVAEHAGVGGPVAIRRWPSRTFPALPLGRPHHDVGVAPTDLRGSLPAGDYRFVARGAVLTYTAATAPTDIDDYWNVAEGSWVTFCAGADTTPTWVRTRTGTAVLTIEGGPAA